jgi:hypothetical protein
MTIYILVLGWGGCGAVLGGIRYYDKRPVRFKRNFIGRNQNDLQDG